MKRASVLTLMALLGASALPATPSRAATAAPGKIAFSHVYTVEPDGSDFTQVGGFSRPTWSPDGSTLMGDSYTGRFIAAVDANGSTHSELFRAPDKTIRVSRPTWAPSGKKIALSMSGFGSNGNSEIIVVTLKTGTWTRLTNSPAFEGSPEWSADGSTIAFWSTRGTDDGIRFLDIASGDVSDPLPHTDTIDEFKWAHHSNTLIWSDSSDGIFTYRLGIDPYPQWLGQLGHEAQFPAWSPDDDRILFTGIQSGQYDLYTAAPDGSDVQQITDTPFTEDFPDWQPVYVSLAIGANELDYGGTTTLDVHLYPYADTTNTLVGVHVRVASGQWRLWRTVDLAASGATTLTIQPDRNTKFFATWAGDATAPKASSGFVGVKVHAELIARLRGAYEKVGDLNKYHLGDPVRYLLLLRPAQVAVVGVNVYRKRGGHWKTVASKTFRTRSDGSLAVAVINLPTGRYRLRSGFGGNTSNLGDETGFSYVRITR